MSAAVLCNVVMKSGTHGDVSGLLITAFVYRRLLSSKGIFQSIIIQQKFATHVHIVSELSPTLVARLKHSCDVLVTYFAASSTCITNVENNENFLNDGIIIFKEGIPVSFAI